MVQNVALVPLAMVEFSTLLTLMVELRMTEMVMDSSASNVVKWVILKVKFRP